MLVLSTLIAGGVLTFPPPVHAQNRGAYPLGMSATNAGVTPVAGFTYSNQLLFYSRDEAKDNDGATLPNPGRNAVILDMNSFTWVSRKSILGGARYSAVATLPLARNELTSDVNGRLSGGGGFGDSYYLPLILGWSGSRASFKILYGFLAPTGRFDPDANDNVGSGYWTSTLSAGQTFDLSKVHGIALSTYEMYEFHTTQEGTGTKPGDTINLDYSVTKTFGPIGGASRFQIGIAGYEQRQLTDKTGPAVPPDARSERYAVNAIGFVSSLLFPNRRSSLGVRVFDEFANRATFQGLSFHVFGSKTF